MARSFQLRAALRRIRASIPLYCQLAQVGLHHFFREGCPRSQQSPEEVSSPISHGFSSPDVFSTPLSTMHLAATNGRDGLERRRTSGPRQSVFAAKSSPAAGIFLPNSTRQVSVSAPIFRGLPVQHHCISAASPSTCIEDQLGGGAMCKGMQLPIISGLISPVTLFRNCAGCSQRTAWFHWCCPSVKLRPFLLACNRGT